MNSAGAVDIQGTDITDQELMAHALANAANTKSSEEFAIRHGSAFVNEYARTDSSGQRTDGGPSDPNHLLGCFPTLFPYGRGGFETNRPINVPYECHARWAMQYSDKRFRKDLQFAFQVFGVCQKREVCRSAVLQMKKSTFARHRNLLATLTPNDLTKASQEETRKVPFSNPAVRALRQQLSAIKTRVRGTDESRSSLRSKIWSTNLIFNPFSLWITINPADIQDPIAQVLCGAEIDLDKFSRTAGPTSGQRAANITGDPFASAQFFHFMVNVIIEILFGIKKIGNNRIEREEGILGTIQSYIGTVETQGRGSLHLHMLIWLKDAPPATVMREALRSDRFRDKIRRYIRTTIHADIQGKDDEETKQLPKAPEVSYSRTINPITNPVESKDQGHQLARAVQYHKCSVLTCLRKIKDRYQCKRRAPFQCAIDAWVKDNGEWGPKRLCAYLNNWNPALLICLRSNHDIKIMLNGSGTHVLTFYITNYATKKQKESSNVSALLAKTLAFHKQQEKHETDIQRINKLLLQRCSNSLARDREFSAPEVMGYVMGWGDRFESHHFVTIYWDSATKALQDEFPFLSSNNQRGVEISTQVRL